MKLSREIIKNGLQEWCADAFFPPEAEKKTGLFEHVLFEPPTDGSLDLSGKICISSFSEATSASLDNTALYITNRTGYFDPNASVIICDAALADIYRRVLETFTAFEDFFEVLQDGLIHNEHPLYLVNHLALFLNNSVMITGLDLHIIAHSGNVLDCSDDVCWNELVNGNQIPSFLMEKLLSDSPADNFPKSESAFLDDKITHPYPTCSIDVVDAGHYFGRVNVITNRTHNIPYILDVLNLLKPLLNGFLIHYNNINPPLLSLRHLIWQEILDGKTANYELMEKQLLMMGWIQNIPYILFCIDVSSLPSTSPRYISLFDYLHESITDNLLFPYQNSLVLICRKIEGLFEANLEKLRKAVLDRKLNIGVSCEFDSFKELQYAFLQAKYAMDCAKASESQGLLWYQSCAVSHFVTAAASQIPVIVLAHPAVYKLKAHDKEKNTDLLNTLFTFLKENKNLVKASEVLHLHKNTLIYRLDKITSSFHIDLKDEEECLWLLLSFFLLESET